MQEKKTGTWTRILTMEEQFNGDFLVIEAITTELSDVFNMS